MVPIAVADSSEISYVIDGNGGEEEGIRNDKKQKKKQTKNQKGPLLFLGVWKNYG